MTTLELNLDLALSPAATFALFDKVRAKTVLVQKPILGRSSNRKIDRGLSKAIARQLIAHLARGMIAARKHLGHHGECTFAFDKLHRLTKVIPITGKIGAVLNVQARHAHGNPNGTFVTALKITIDMRTGLFRRITARERGGRFLIGKDDRGLGHRIRHVGIRYSSSSSSIAEPSMAYSSSNSSGAG